MAKRTKVPKQFVTSILIRAVGEKGIADLAEQYRDACYKLPTISEPKKSELRLASLARTEGYKGAAVKVGVDVSRVYSAVSRVSRYNFFTGKK